MSLLYLAGESEADEDFYASCATKLTGRVFNKIRLRNRKGSGVDAVKKQMRNALAMAMAAADGQEPVFFLAAMDNDRAPHPEHEKRPPAGTGLERARLIGDERNLESRYDWMKATVEERRKSKTTNSLLYLALAVPVEMLEAWIVRVLRDAHPMPMPHFSHSDSQGVREYYEEDFGTCPPQWKDLASEEQTKSGCATKRDFYEHVVNRLDADALALRSLSFQMFKEWLDQWPRATGGA
jgi:hypothetical protein